MALPSRQESQLRSIVRDGQRRSIAAGAVAGVGEDPATIPGDADEGHVIAVGIERTKNVRR
jgi:hypothetical protein